MKAIVQSAWTSYTEQTDAIFGNNKDTYLYDEQSYCDHLNMSSPSLNSDINKWPRCKNDLTCSSNVNNFSVST